MHDGDFAEDSSWIILGVRIDVVVNIAIIHFHNAGLITYCSGLNVALKGMLASDIWFR